MRECASGEWEWEGGMVEGSFSYYRKYVHVS